jgi:hypothetical protein
MTTKQQEREALERIRKIVEALGEQSYIGTAFEGCFEIAEQNIEYDAAFSMKEERDIARGEAKSQEAAAKEANFRLAGEQARGRELNGNLVYAKDEYDKLKDDFEKIRVAYIEPKKAIEEKLAAVELELLKLKARLYDQMTAGE